MEVKACVYFLQYFCFFVPTVKHFLMVIFMTLFSITKLIISFFSPDNVTQNENPTAIGNFLSLPHFHKFVGKCMTFAQNQK